MRYVVLGTGLLGSALTTHLDARGVQQVTFDHATMQAGGGISRAAASVVRSEDVVVNAAAMTNVDGCEDRREEAMEVNGEEPGRLAALCRERGARLVHISTDSVLDVTNVYAESKALGEARVRELGAEDALILRISTVFGPHPRKVDFVRFIVAALREKGRARGVTDMICSPTYTLDAARAIVAAVAGGARGVHQFVNEPSISRFEFARLIQRAWDAPGVVEPVPMASFQFRARRPKDTTMRSTLDAWYAPMPLVECLADYRTRWP